MAVSEANQHPSELDPQTKEAIYRATYEDFPTFIDLIWSQGYEEFTRGDWILRRAQFMQGESQTCYVGPRNHFKTSGIHAHFGWKTWRARFNALSSAEWAEGPKDLEAHYFSYKQKSAGYQIGESSDSIKDLLANNPWFSGLEDLKPTATTKGQWSWDGGEHKISIDPHGMLSHVRGIHCDVVYIDDPFQDPENELNPTTILKINHVFKTGVYSIPKVEDGDEIHIVTTPQTEEDFTFDRDLMDEFAHQVIPAIEDEQQEEVIWPEWFTYSDLMAKKEQIGPKLFNQEYMCSPKSSEVGFFRDEHVQEMVVPALPDWGEDGIATGSWAAPWANCTGVVAGHDIGKRQHPAHFVVFACLERPTPDGKGKLKSSKAGHLVQLHQKWMDGWDYTRQNEYHKQAVDYFGLDSIWIDNTRGEFDSLDEMGQLPSQSELVSLSGGTKGEMAGYLDVFSGAGRVKLLNDGRQKRQLTVVTQDLDAVETNEGHGEPFTSIGLALMASQKRNWGSSFGTLEM
jgi:hypothetical protein